MGRSSSLHIAAGFMLLAFVGRSAVQWAVGGSSAAKSSAISGGDVTAVGAASAATGLNNTSFGTASIAYRLFSALSDDGGGDNNTCAHQIQQQYHCSEEDCEDLVAGE